MKHFIYIADRVVIYLAVIWILVLATRAVLKTPEKSQGLENRVTVLERRCDEAFTGAQ